MPIRLWTGQACAAPLSVSKNFMIPACLAAAAVLNIYFKKKYGVKPK